MFSVPKEQTRHYEVKDISFVRDLMHNLISMLLTLDSSLL